MSHECNMIYIISSKHAMTRSKLGFATENQSIRKNNCEEIGVVNRCARERDRFPAR